jgi:putative flippase GtrA
MNLGKAFRQASQVLDAIVAALAGVGMSEDFVRFGMVGTVGLCCDTTTVYTLRPFIGLYGAGAAGFMVAASMNWLLNRLWTFKRQEHEPARIQWPKFVAANLIGFTLNRGTFFILISLSTLCADKPFVAIFVGTMVGLALNYFLSKRFIFR